MKLLEELNPRKYSRVLGIDPSSRKIACTLIDLGAPTATVAIDLGRSADIFERLKEIRIRFPAVLEMYKPQMVGIEQTIFVQNHATVRKLSYIVGAVMAEILYRDMQLIDVSPTEWKASMGIKMVSRAEKARIVEEFGQTEGRKKIQNLKKSQTQDFLRKSWPAFSWDDDDIADSAGVALYVWENYGKRP